MADLPQLIYPDAGQWIDALQAGQKAGMTQRRQAALQSAGKLMTQGDYTGAANAVLPVDIKSGVELQQYGAQQNILQRQMAFRDALANHDIGTARQLSAGDPELTKDFGDYMSQTASTLASYVAPLKDLDPAQREQVYQTQVLPKLHEMGFSGPGYDDWQPTDQAIQQVETTAIGLKGMMDYNKPVVVGDHLVSPGTGKTLYNAPKIISAPNASGGTDIVSVDTGPGGAAAGGTATAGGGSAQSPVAPAPSETPASAPIPQGGIYAQVGQIASQNGANPGEVAYLQRLAQVESNGDPNARNGSSTGLFQFHPDTFATAGGGNINDVGDQTKAALNLQRRDRATLQQIGVAPTDENAYILHQQGAAGGRALLTAQPDANAVSVLTPIYGDTPKGRALARAAIVNNGGSPDMTAGQFVQMWHTRWNNGGLSPDHGMLPPGTLAAGGDPQNPSRGPQLPGGGSLVYQPPGQAAAANGAAPGVRVLYSTDSGAAPISDDTVDLLAGRYLRDGTIPPMGMGKAGVIVREKILNRAADMAKSLGLSAGDLVSGMADLKASGQALNKAQTQMSLTQGYENTALANANLALSLAPKGGAPGQMPVLNRWIQYGRKQIAGDKDVAAFDQALGTFADEYAKVMSGSLGGQGSTDSARATAYQRINGAMTQQQLQSVIAVMQKEMANRLAAQQDVIEGLRTHIRTGGANQTVVAPSTPPANRPPIDSFFGH